MLRAGLMEGVLKQPRERLFDLAGELGFHGVELEFRDDTEELRGLVARSGIPVSSLLCGGEGAGHPDPDQRREALERLRRAVNGAASLGVRGILWPMFTLTQMDDAAAIERFIEDVSACARWAEEAGVVIAWENALNAADTRTLVEQVGSAYFRCYFDFANAAKRGADPVSEIQSLAGLIYQVHAKNTHKQHLDGPGVDLAACLAELQRQEYAGWIVLETPAGDDPLDSARHNLSVLTATWNAVSSQA